MAFDRGALFASLPEFPSFREVTLELALALQPFFRSLAPAVSEFTATNLYLFRRAHGYRASRRGRLLLLVAKGYDGKGYAFPPLGEGDVEEASLRLCDWLSSQGEETPILFPVPAGLRDAHFGTGGWRAEGDRAQADYVYRREDLATLQGKSFHKRKNRLAKFLREEADGYSYSPLGAEHVDACRELASGWCSIRCSLDRPSTYLETAAADDALVHAEVLGLRGGVISLRGEVAAFCLGEPLNPETFVVHFEKAQAGHEGLAQLINRDFCLRELGEYSFVNREQDLGDPGLRRAKESYHPVFLAEKYRISPV